MNTLSFIFCLTVSFDYVIHTSPTYVETPIISSVTSIELSRKANRKQSLVAQARRQDSYTKTSKHKLPFYGGRLTDDDRIAITLQRTRPEFKKPRALCECTEESDAVTAAAWQ